MRGLEDGIPLSRSGSSLSSAGSNYKYTDLIEPTMEKSQVEPVEIEMREPTLNENPDELADIETEKSALNEKDGVKLRFRRCKASMKRKFDAKKHFLAFYILIVVAYCTYFVAALIHNFERAVILIVLTAIAIAVFAWILLRDKINELSLVKRIRAFKWDRLNPRLVRRITWVIYAGLLIAFVIFVIAKSVYDASQGDKGTTNPWSSAQSLLGIVSFLLFALLFCKDRSKIQLRPIIGGLVLQFLFALFVLRTEWGRVAFKFLGDLMATFLSFTDYGSKFVFGENYKEHFFAFHVLPIIIYFSCIVNILYHVGVMQFVISKIAWFMQKLIGTTAAESVNAAGNIFLGQTEAPMLVRPMLQDLTMSELHAVMATGFATISCGVLGAYISFGIPANHLLAASIMNAAAGLVFAKLIYPETSVSKAKSFKDTPVADDQQARNVIEAASNGASMAVGLCGCIAANLIAFIALLKLINALVAYFGSLVGYANLSFEIFCSYVFRPVAFLMGIRWADCGYAAEMIGLRLFMNEFLAYTDLADRMDLRAACSVAKPLLTVRSEAIIVYAMCGFASVGSIGIQLGGIGAMVPSRRSDLAELAPRALLAGTLATFMSAAMASLLIEEEVSTCFLGTVNSTALYNSTWMP